jgi:hypothetical protein
MFWQLSALAIEDSGSGHSAQGGFYEGIILDWQMPVGQEDASLLCKRIIVSLFNEEEGVIPRVLIIYTGESVTQTLGESLILCLPDNIQSELRKNNADLTDFSIGRLHVIFFEKGTPDQNFDTGKKILPTDIPNKVIESYSVNTKGILPCSIFNVISSIRENAGKLAATLNNSLDYAFIYHLLSTQNCDDSKFFLASQIVDEFLSVVEGSAVLDFLTDSNFLVHWIEENHSEFKDVLPKDACYASLGLQGADPKKLTSGQKKNFADLFIASMAAFSRITDFRFETASKTRNYFGKVPFLTFGSLIASLSGDIKYYICIAPACDTVRINGGRTFPLLELSVSNSMDGAYVCFPGDCSKFGILPKTDRNNKIWNNIKLIIFSADNDTERVVAVENDANSFIFTSEDGQKFEWMADIKHSTMLELHKKIFPVMSRLGTDAFEWIRSKRDEWK